MLRREELALEAAAIPPGDVPSCLQLFDKWLSCYALGSQFRHAYRYGTVADCHRYSDDFKFCLTMRELDPGAKRDAYLRRRADERAHARRGLRSSEAVWEMRRDPLLDPALVDPEYAPPTWYVHGVRRIRLSVLLPNGPRPGGQLYHLNDAPLPCRAADTRWYASHHACPGLDQYIHSLRWRARSAGGPWRFASCAPAWRVRADDARIFSMSSAWHRAG